MTKIVIDTNIVFSALLNVNSRIGQIILNGSKYYDFFAPEYLRHEIIENKEKIKSLAKLSEDEFLELYELIMHHITVLNHSLIPKETYKNAVHLCSSIDLDDTIFVAVSEFTRGKLWTGDLKLINGLQEKSFKRIIRTEELYQEFIIKENRKK